MSNLTYRRRIMLLGRPSILTRGSLRFVGMFGRLLAHDEPLLEIGVLASRRVHDAEEIGLAATGAEPAVPDTTGRR